MAKRKKNQTNPIHNAFYTTISSHKFRAEEGEGSGAAPGSEGPGGKYTGGGGRGSSTRGRRSEREEYNINVADAHELAMRNPARAGRELAFYKTQAAKLPRGTPGPAAAEVSEEYRRPRVSQTDVVLARRSERETSWRTHPGVYRVEPRERKSPGGFISQEAAGTHKHWIESQLRDPNSEFNQGLPLDRAKTGRYTPAQRRRLSIYTDALQQGSSHQDALQRVRQSRLRQAVGRPPERRVATRASQAQAVVSGRSRAKGRETKYQSLVPQAGEINVGISAQRPPSMDEIKRSHPNESEQGLLQIQQAGTENISQELLANQKWAHETRRANLLGHVKGGKEAVPDKVTIFTTNVGHPSVSVPSASLVGQYIIKKRKSILGQTAGVPGTQLRGEFPRAVRDAHIIDIGTGASVGVQGRSGVFNTTGYKVGKRSSPGYGRPRPLGAQVLYDTSTGRPLYDAQGNIRYSEGATRPVDWTTPSLGFRVLLG